MVSMLIILYTAFFFAFEKTSYKKDNKSIILEYKLSSDEENFKIEINVKDDINE